MQEICARKRIDIAGLVQGVGFRPFVYRIARQFEIRGYVLNSSEGVVIEAEASETRLENFIAALKTELPPLARIDRLNVRALEPLGEAKFTIRQSAAIPGRFALVPSDTGTCEECAADFTDPANRRYQYPFTNCTNCGPRYSIIREAPYDRPKTTMDEFAMCDACLREYEDPADRRFHAEPNACPECGPGLALMSGAEIARGAALRFTRDPQMLKRARELLAQAKILAIKGLGGFHLACDAASDRAVALLRERKRRSGKAFAIMARDTDAAARLCAISRAERELLTSPRRPILLLPRLPNAAISAEVAPGNARLGVMLPYTPLHHLLFEDAPFDALVMTSGNHSEEPIVSRNEDAPRLRSLADYFLLHNRKIQTRVDDSVVACFEGGEYPVRRSRGFAPDPIDLGMPLREILACGGELKNTLCLTADHYAILSQHIGDLENLETMEFFRETLEHLKRFFRVRPAVIAHDLHPNYLSTRFAQEQAGARLIGVQHHHAHIASCMADRGIGGRVIGVAFDGTGYGTDGKIWGGEFLICDFAGFERRGHLAYVPLAGGDRAVRQPWRGALAYLDGARPAIPLFDQVPAKQVAFVEQMIARRIQTVETSSCGRLFDAVSSMLGIRQEITYESQAAVELEAAATEGDEVYPFEIVTPPPQAWGEARFQIDMRPAIRAIAADFTRGAAVGRISANFHETMAHVIVEACLRIRESHRLNRVCLSGGTFQNLRLLARSVAGLRAAGFEIFVHRRIPANDGGLSLGQAVIANALCDRA
jgi:hydrogenase maturation protein HypF